MNIQVCKCLSIAAEKKEYLHETSVCVIILKGKYKHRSILILYCDCSNRV